ncbi:MULTISPECIES: hypothetical protein [unclassified Streptomyces]|uniref:hypothetical protein n=1 Tax=unclassified Streptomyces TaxID=2593676 RepID=UPI001BEC5F0D|nr:MULTISPECIES: hypothetical protein [unclassified Streptomyces]MBT2408922.1 hypothetical protein [Streptomyces sp. ISL-21]MBT2459187.1 hypothetical protein [Streptomyces sp. ISL-86]
MKVHVTATSTTFEVISESYMEDAGSTISFTASEKNGQLVMTQHGESVGSNLLIVIAVQIFNVADSTWSKMGGRIRDMTEPGWYERARWPGLAKIGP